MFLRKTFFYYFLGENELKQCFPDVAGIRPAKEIQINEFGMFLHLMTVRQNHFLPMHWVAKLSHCTVVVAAPWSGWNVLLWSPVTPEYDNRKSLI